MTEMVVEEKNKIITIEEGELAEEEEAAVNIPLSKSNSIINISSSGEEKNNSCSSGRMASLSATAIEKIKRTKIKTVAMLFLLASILYVGYATNTSTASIMAFLNNSSMAITGIAETISRSSSS